MSDALPSTAVPAPAATAGDRAAVLAGLRAQVRRMEGLGGENARALPFGVAGIDEVLPGGGLPLGCLHAVTASPGAGAGSATAFAAVLLGRLATARAPALWILRGRDLHAAGLAAYGLTPDRLIAVRAVRQADALWAMEEALRCSTLSAVLGEVDGVDLTASRRLQLAAESSGVTGLLLRLEGMGRRTADLQAANTAVTRWRLDSLPSRPGDEPGVGAEHWRVVLERCRGGQPGAWTLEWRDGGRLHESRDDDAEAAPLTAPQPPKRLERVA